MKTMVKKTAKKGTAAPKKESMKMSTYKKGGMVKGMKPKGK